MYASNAMSKPLVEAACKPTFLHTFDKLLELEGMRKTIISINPRLNSYK
jgi:2-C-methyl-D-erythritol 4-phosphate cytidylyltransferase